LAEAYYKFISGHLAKVYSQFISGAQMQLRLGIWQRFTTSLLVMAEAAEAADLVEVYYKFISDGKMQLRLEVWQRFITSLLVIERCS